MKGLLRFLPAMFVGLLAGRGLAVWLLPASGTNAAFAGAAVPATAAHQAEAATNSAWQKLLDARAALPASPQDAPAFLEIGKSLLADSALSPFRRVLEMEKLRSTLPVGLLKGSVNVMWSSPDRHAGVEEAFARLAKHDPQQAFEALNNLAANRRPVCRDSSTTERLRSRILREWLRQDSRAALAAVTDGGTGYERGFRLQSLLQEWSRIDPAAAAAAFATLPEGGPGFERKNYAQTLFQGWHKTDPTSARQWAQTQADPALRESLQTLADELAAQDPAAKAAVLLAAPQRDGPKLATALGEWLTENPVAALAKLSAIPAEDKFWQNGAADAAQWWAMFARSGMTSEQFLEPMSSVPPGPQREAMLQGLAHYGASNDIPFAVRMVAEMNEGREREQAVGSLTELWMRKDPVKTSEWLATLPTDADSRHSGVARFAECLAPDDPERAAQWAASLPDGYWQKESVMKTVLEKWRAKDPAAAEAWLGGLKTNEFLTPAPPG